MTVTAAMITKFKTMVGEDTDCNLTDAQITVFISEHPVADRFCEEPLTWNMSTSPPTSSANADWIATYDLHAAAADYWEGELAKVAGQFDFEADGGKFSRSQKIANFERQRAYHLSRRYAASRTQLSTS